MALTKATQIDFLQRIVNVHWADKGCVFVAGGYAEFVLFAKIKSKDDLSGDLEGKEIFSDLGHLDAFTIQGGAVSWPAANVGAGSCKEIVDSEGKRKVTFILGGNDAVRDDATGTFGSGSVVMVSHDGKKWTKAFRHQWPDHVGNDSGVMALAWDTNKFYGYVSSAEYYSAEPDDRTEMKSYDRLLASGDGDNWSEAGQELRGDTKDPPFGSSDPPGLFMGHLNPVANMPDGKFGYYEKKDSEGVIVESYLAVPSIFDNEWYLHGGFLASRYGNSISLTILRDNKTTKSTLTTPITHVTCVAVAAGILMAGGASDSEHAQIAASIDDGKTWKIVWQGTDDMHAVINTITGALLSHTDEI